MTKKDKKMATIVTKDLEDISPILIPSGSIIEGYVKTKKSFRIECNYYGTIMSSQKVVIGKTSKIIGDIICRNLDFSGELVGNIFCSGKIRINGGSKIKGKIYTRIFENEENSDLDCVIQIPKEEHITKVEELFENLDTMQPLSNDKSLGEIRSIFYDNVYAHRSNPDEPLIQDFTTLRTDQGTEKSNDKPLQDFTILRSQSIDQGTEKSNDKPLQDFVAPQGQSIDQDIEKSIRKEN